MRDETDYTVAVYVVDKEAFTASNTEDTTYTLERFWTYSKSIHKKDKYQPLIKVSGCGIVKNEKTGEILEFICTPVE